MFTSLARKQILADLFVVAWSVVKSRATYQRVICACCFLLLFTNIGLPSSSFSVYQPYIAAMVGDGNASFVVGCRTGMSLLCMLLVGFWYKKLDCRLGMVLATVLTVIGFFLYCRAQDMVLLCIAAAITGAAYGLGGMVGMTLLIGRWYRERLGTAVGIATMGSGFASLVIPLIATMIINNFGLTWSFAFEAILAALVAVILLILLQNQPTDAEPMYSKDVKAEGASARLDASQQDPILTPALRHVMLFGMVLIGAVSVVGQSYLSILLTTQGFDHVFAATMLSVNGAFLMVAKGANGWVFDKLGRRRGSVIFFSFLVVGIALLCLTWTGSYVVAVVGASLMGIGVALATVGISVWSIDLSTPVERPALVKNMQIGYATGSFLYNLVPGTLAEVTGTYVSTYLVCLVMAIICAACVLCTYRKLRR